MRIVLTIGLLSFFILSFGQSSNKMVFIKGGTYVPLFSLKAGKVNVKSFYMDMYPVTNFEFQQFVNQYPEWQKQNVKAIFADKNYLKNWSMNNQIGKNANQLKNTPVVYVSWFAAKKYCECQGKRLPTIDEWEFVGRASQTKMDATNEPAFLQQILDWYAKPTPSILNNVGIGFKNVYGLYDIHGLVWEWNLDFIAALSIKDSRDGNNLNSTEFCGAASNNSSTPQNYAAFMRYAMRSSLKANYSQPNLGFRCVKEVK